MVAATAAPAPPPSAAPRPSASQPSCSSSSAPIVPAHLVYGERERRQNAFIAGVFAGSVSIIGTFWLDVRKVQSQLKGKNFSPIKGMMPAIASQAMRTGITYCGFDSFGQQFKRWGLTGIFWEFIAAASGAIIGESIACPLDVWKNSSIKNQHIRTMAIPGHIVKTTGPLAFFNGIAAAALRKSISNGGLLSVGPYSVKYCYRSLCSVFPDYKGTFVLQTASKLLGGGLAGGVMEVMTLPIDKCKLYSQAVVNPATGKNYTTLQAMGAVWRDGFFNMFSGASAAFIRKGLIKAIQYFVLIETVEFLKRRSQATALQRHAEIIRQNREEANKALSATTPTSGIDVMKVIQRDAQRSAANSASGGSAKGPLIVFGTRSSSAAQPPSPQQHSSSGSAALHVGKSPS